MPRVTTNGDAITWRCPECHQQVTTYGLGIDTVPRCYRHATRTRTRAKRMVPVMLNNRVPIPRRPPAA